MLIPDYCREIEAYLCRKNDGHLIRVTGPSFDLVAGWARRGVPIKVAFRGIDRYFERYYRKGPRRRPVKIDFCEADVLDAFDDWRRALGLAAVPVGTAETDAEAAEGDQADGSGASESRDHDHATPSMPSGRHGSLPDHLKRVVLRLTAARTGALDAAFDGLIDRAAAELDRARGLRGEARRAMVDRLEALDRELLQQARALLDPDARASLLVEAEAELEPFRAGMSPDAFLRARDAAVDRLVRERYKLPVVAFRPM